VPQFPLVELTAFLQIHHWVRDLDQDGMEVQLVREMAFRILA